MASRCSLTLRSAPSRCTFCELKCWFWPSGGLPDERAGEVVLAVHELAANVICHGGGKGRLRVWQPAGALHCQVDDGDLIASADPPVLL